jgi:magnesium transporter
MMTTAMLQDRRLTFETAAEHLCTRVPIATPDATVREMRMALDGRRFDTVVDIAICDGTELVGLVKIEDVLAAPPEILARDLMDADPPVVTPEIDQEVAAWKAVRHGQNSLAVTDAAGRFLGLVPPQRILSVLLAEHREDIDRLSGYLRSTLSAREAAIEPVARRFWHRLPWLIMGLIGALLAADAVGAFEGSIEENVMLAFFIPGVVYLADAVGTQTEAIVVRGFSVGVGIRSIFRREAFTGVLMGGCLALAALPLVWWRWGDPAVAGAVSLALVLACSVATIVAMALPAALYKMGKDPAFGSGPLATVLQDLLSILIYLAIAKALI